MTYNEPNITTILWRGLHFGSFNDTEVAAIAADPAGWLKANLDTDLGVHWTDDPVVAWRFSQNRDTDGWAFDDDSDDEDTTSVGVVIEATFPNGAILDPGSDAWEQWAATNAIFDRDHPESEVTVTGPDTATDVSFTFTLVAADGTDTTLRA